MKRKWFGIVLPDLGAFLARRRSSRCDLGARRGPRRPPLDVNQVTHLRRHRQEAERRDGELEENPVKVQNITQVDSDASTDDTAVWVGTTCVVADIDNAPTASTATTPADQRQHRRVRDRPRLRTAIPDFKGLPPDAVPHEGLVNDSRSTRRRRPPYWDGTAGYAVDATYDRTETLEGIECYVYTFSFEDVPIEIAEGIDGTYDNLSRSVEPKTGAIQQQTQDQQRYAR